MPETPHILHLFHTNDLHGRLSDTGAARLKAAMDTYAEEPTLYLDAGDAVKAGNIGVSPCGEPILDTMSELGCAAMTMGNREFHIWKAAFATKVKQAKFPVLCANIHAKSSPETLPVVPHTLCTIGGLTVAVFGVTVPMVTARMKAALLSDFLFDEVIATAKQQVAQLRYKADVLIALTHIGLTQDKRLAEAVPGIDLIVGGHSHNILEVPDIVNGTPIVQTGSHARFFGHCKLTVTRQGVAVDYTLQPLQEPARRSGK